MSPAAITVSYIKHIFLYNWPYRHNQFSDKHSVMPLPWAFLMSNNAINISVSVADTQLPAPFRGAVQSLMNDVPQLNWISSLEQSHLYVGMQSHVKWGEMGWNPRR